MITIRIIYTSSSSSRAYIGLNDNSNIIIKLKEMFLKGDNYETVLEEIIYRIISVSTMYSDSIADVG